MSPNRQATFLLLLARKRIKYFALAAVTVEAGLRLQQLAR